MAIRVPLLLQKAVAVIYRLDIPATRGINPPGEDTIGFDDEFNEPIVRDNSETTPNTRASTRQEMAAVYVPCQVEMLRYEDLRQLAVGDAPVTDMALVFHRRDLQRLGLLSATKDVILKKGDRIGSLEKDGSPVGTTIKTFSDPGLYIYEVRPRSWGFGPDGYDLELALTTKRREGALP